MQHKSIYLSALFFLMLISGVFWGTWFTLTRSIESFSSAEFIHIGKVIIANVALPMRIRFNEAISFIVNCETQEEIDYYWNKLKEGGDERSQVCGWLKDKFGVSWQIVPVALSGMLNDPDQRKAQRVMKALMQMKKLDLAALEKA